MQVVHLSPRLPLSLLLSISLLTRPCVHNLITKQGVDSHYGNPGKQPGHFPPYLGSPFGGGTLALTAPLFSNLCVCSVEVMLQRWLSLSTGYNEIGPPG